MGELSFHDFRVSLARRLRADLPGIRSQMKMVPEARRREIEGYIKSDQARKAAVLICFFPQGNDEINLVLIKRNEYDGVHSGQISFPGGTHEKGDQDLVFTALREAEEETNIRMKEVEVLGEITPVFIPPSNFIVRAIVGWTNRKPELIPDPQEVSAILTVSLNELMHPENRQQKIIQHREFNSLMVPCFYIQGQIIWGATAMMLSEIVDLVDSM